MSSNLPGESKRRRRAGQIAQAYRTVHEVVSAAASVAVMVLLGSGWIERLA